MSSNSKEPTSETKTNAAKKKGKESTESKDAEVKLKITL